MAAPVDSVKGRLAKQIGFSEEPHNGFLICIPHEKKKRGQKKRPCVFCWLLLEPRRSASLEKENKVICPNESGRSQEQRTESGSLLLSVCQPRPPVESDSLGRPTQHVPVEPLQAECQTTRPCPQSVTVTSNSHSQQLGGWTANHAGLLDLLALDSVHRSISRPPDGDSWTVTGSTITEIKLRAACREGEGSRHAQPSIALPNLAPARRASPACQGLFSHHGLAT